MPAEPPVKRTIAYINGQNLFHAVHAAFGYTSLSEDLLAHYTKKPLIDKYDAASGIRQQQNGF